MRPKKEAATAETMAVERKTKTTTILYLLNKELQSIFGLLSDPFILPKAKPTYELLLISTLRKYVALQRGAGYGR